MKMKPKKILYREWAEEWLLNKKDFVKESTYANYATVLYNHLIPDLGETSLQSVNHNMLQQYILDKLKSGRIGENSHLSEKTVKDIMMVLKSTIRYAMNQGAMNVIDLDFTYPKNTKKKKIYILTKKEQKKITDYVLENLTPRNLGILISLYSGMRIGEICALKWEDIDLNKKTIYIKHTLQRVYVDCKSTKILIDVPKSEKSLRSIPMSNLVYSKLKEIKENYKKEDFFLTGNSKHFLEPRGYQYTFKKCLDECRVNYRNFHCLRHTFATDCINVGMDVKSLSEILGHSDVSITLNRYVHSSDKMKKRYLEKLA